MEPKFESLLANNGGNATALAFLVAFSLLLPLASLPLPPVAAAENVPYSISVVARCSLEQGNVAVPIYMDGHDTGFSTPHQFTDLKGLHTISSVNEHESGHFIQGPPQVEGNVSNLGLTIMSEGVNWIQVGSPDVAGPNGTVEFTYGSIPFVENVRGTFQPGTVARLGVLLNANPTRIASGHMDVYNETGAPPFYSTDFALNGAQPAFVQFYIPKDVPAGSWTYQFTAKDTNLDFTEHSTFDVANLSSIAPASYPPGQPLQYTTFDLAGSQYVLFNNPNSSAVVLYIGGGMIGETSGPTPINGYSDVGRAGSAGYRLVYDLYRSGFSVVAPSGPWQGLDFPSQLVGRLRAQGFKEFYAVGHSAGGVVVGWSILNSPGLFSRAVIADAPLTQKSTGFFFTALSVRSEQVKIPHMLIWGRGDAQASLSDAYAWMDHADQSLASLEIYDYYHDWAGTAAELQVRQQIVNFLKGDVRGSLGAGASSNSSAFMGALHTLEAFRSGTTGAAALIVSALFGSAALLAIKGKKRKRRK